MHRTIGNGLIKKNICARFECIERRGTNGRYGSQVVGVFVRGGGGEGAAGGVEQAAEVERGVRGVAGGAEAERAQAGGADVEAAAAGAGEDAVGDGAGG